MKKGYAIEGYIVEDKTLRPIEKYDDTELRGKIQTNTDNIDNLDSRVSALEHGAIIGGVTPGNLAAFDDEGKIVDGGPKSQFDHNFIADDENNGISVAEGVIDIQLYDGETGGELSIPVDELPNLARALQDPAAPAEDGNKLITNGQVYSALAGKANTNHTHSGYALTQHTHLPVDIQGAIPTFVSYDGTAALDLDGLIEDDWGMRRLCIQNNSSEAALPIYNLFTWDASIPLHINTHSSATLDIDEYVMVTIYKIDKHMNPDDEHEHDLCYFITIDGIFDDGNNS